MDDQKLTDHFSLFELTTTSHPEFQKENRNLNEAQIGRLREVAKLLEKARDILGVPLKVISGYRCPSLNSSPWIGSKPNSQHVRSEAADFIPIGLDLGKAFRLLWKEVQLKNIPVGQLIFETTQGREGQTSWIHISLGSPWRDQTLCAQVLRMKDGKYSPFNEATV